MGKAVKAVSGAVSSVVKNPIGAIGGAAATGLNQIKGAVDGVFGGFGGGGGGAGPELNKQAFDLSPQAAAYEKLATEARTRNLEANQRFTNQLEAQARGEGPSLATAQLKMAQNRNLAQTLAAAQSAGINPLNTRQLIQQRGAASRDVAELAGVQKLQEQQAAQQALGQQLGQQANIARGDISQGFEISRAPVDLQANYETNRFAADVARTNAIKQQQSQILGGLLNAGASAGMMAAMSDERNKRPPTFSEALSKYTPEQSDDLIAAGLDSVASVAKNAAFKKMSKKDAGDVSSDKNNKKTTLPDAGKEVNDFLDKLVSKQYEYKDTSLPGTAEGIRYGILAQDLEKSKVGKTLVKNTPTGKMVDTVQGFGAVLAAQSELNKRLKKLEGKK